MDIQPFSGLLEDALETTVQRILNETRGRVSEVEDKYGVTWESRSGGGRLPLIGPRKPAPKQEPIPTVIAWAGYTGTSIIPASQAYYRQDGRWLNCSTNEQWNHLRSMRDRTKG